MFPLMCLSVCNALTFESVDLENSFFVAGTSSEWSGKVRISRSLGQGQGHGHRSKKECVSCSCSKCFDLQRSFLMSRYNDASYRMSRLYEGHWVKVRVTGAET